MMRLRVHHLLCSALYVGEGYSGAFCENMRKAVLWLWGENEQREAFRDGQKEADCAGQMRDRKEIRLTAAPDEICGACPNLGEAGCLLDDNRVVSKDEALARALGLKTEHLYSVPELLRIVEKNLTEDVFETSCHNCEWYAKGLCRYEKLAEKYQNRRK